MIYEITCFFLRLILRLFFDYKAYGMENLPKKGCFIIAANHTSHIDPPAVGVFIRRKVNYVAKKELFPDNFFGWYMRKIRAIPVDKNAPAKGMRQVIEAIKKGYPLVIFPEGTRSDGAKFLEPEQGIGYFALKHKLPVVPAYIKGAVKAMPKGQHFFTRHPVRVYYGKPKMYYAECGMAKDEAYKSVSRQIMTEIEMLKAKYGA